MIYALPVTLGTTVVKKPLSKGRRLKQMTNGYDANGVRVTNIVGFQKGDFVKVCPHCGRELPASMFGLRYDVQNAKQRDQSYCGKCRSNHT